MPSDDRERHFENALAGHLRASGAAGNAYGSCPDAETVAAYHEGALDPQHTALLKTHLSDCQRCQQILAHLQSTDEIPAPATNTAVLANAPTSADRVLPIRRRAVWRWVAPAGALAAALLVWIAVRENTSVQVPVQAPEVALQRNENKVQAPPAPVLSPSIDATRSKQSISPDQAMTVNPAPRSQTAQLPKPLRQSFSKEKDSASAAKKAPGLDDFGQFASRSPNPSNSPASGRDLKSMSPGAVTESVTVVPAPAEIATNQLPKSAVGGQAANKRDESSPSPPPAPGVAGGVVAAPAQPEERVQSMSETVEVTDAAVQQQHMDGMSRFDQKAEVRLAKALAEGIISAPDGRVSWRVGQAGLIQFSSDAGKTWTVQPSGVIVDLLAGSAPNDKVCWIVGRVGTVLRTTDAGKHWQKTLAPTQEDLHSVFAINAHAATVSVANGSYQTTDGGATWKKLPE
jgi:hypothetical protein